MAILHTICRILSGVAGLYSLLCIIRIFLTWIPQMSYNRVTVILSKICDPYLNLFRRFHWLRIGSFDFSPAIGLVLLGVLSTAFTRLSFMTKFSVGQLLSVIVYIAWSVLSSLIGFFIILLIFRLIMLLINHNNYYTGNPIMEAIDRSISPILYNIAKTFIRKRKVTYRTAIIMGIICFVIVQLCGSALTFYICSIFDQLPF